MSSSIRLVLLIGGLVLLGAGLGALFFSRGKAQPLIVPLEKNEGRLVAAIVPVPKSSVTPTPSPSASPAVSPSPTTSPTASPTASPDETPKPSPTPPLGGSPTPRPTFTPRPTPKFTPVNFPPTPVEPTPRPTREPTPRPTEHPTPPPTPRPTFTPKPTPVQTKTPKPKGQSIFDRILDGLKNRPTPTPPQQKQTPNPNIKGEIQQPENAPAGAERGFWGSLSESVQTAFGFLAQTPPVQTAEAAPAGSVERETIDLSYPTELNVKGSGTIELKITHANEPGSTAKDGKAVLADSSIELETDRCSPDDPLSACLTDYEMRAAASLVGSGFEITSDNAQNTPKKIGGGSSPVWRWSIKPKSDMQGAQEMFLTLNFTWTKGAETLGPDASRPKDFRIYVAQPFFEWGTVSIAGLILSMLGPILTLPWLYERSKDLMQYYRNRKVKEEVEKEEDSSQ